MPIAKEESDLLTLRKYACSGSEKFFIGTDSAPHEIQFKENENYIMEFVLPKKLTPIAFIRLTESASSLAILFLRSGTPQVEG